jgi:hypothetical protein
MSGTAFVIDVSGSMTGPQVEAACAVVRSRFRPGDCVLTAESRALWSVRPGEPLGQIHLPVLGRGGSQGLREVRSLLASAGASGHRTVLLTDGDLPPEDLSLFDEVAAVAA